ncbi:unnamed protein product, partial [Sphacelaria rigidula]
IPDGTPPIATRSYHTNPLFSDRNQVILDRSPSTALMRHSTSPWGSPLVVVQKKNKKNTPSGNSQPLNAGIKIARLPLPGIDKIIDSLDGCKIFSNFDTQSGYHQLVMDLQSKELT